MKACLFIVVAIVLFLAIPLNFSVLPVTVDYYTVSADQLDPDIIINVIQSGIYAATMGAVNALVAAAIMIYNAMKKGSAKLAFTASLPNIAMAVLGLGWFGVAINTLGIQLLLEYDVPLTIAIAVLSVVATIVSFIILNKKRRAVAAAEDEPQGIYF